MPKSNKRNGSSYIKIILKIFYSNRLMGFSILAFAIAMAVATFIENDYGTTAAKAVIYNTKWFEVLMLLMVINFIGSIFKYKLYELKKFTVLLIHLSFIVILLGSFITRYYSYEGVMPIREGKYSNTIYSDKIFLTVNIDNSKIELSKSFSVLFSTLTKNKFEYQSTFNPSGKNPKEVSVNLVNYIPHAQESFKKSETGKTLIHLVESFTGKRKDIFLEKGDIKNIGNILFTVNNPVKGGINLFITDDNKYSIQSPFGGSVTQMATQQTDSVKTNIKSPLKLRSLYHLGELRFVIPEIAKGKIIKQSAPKNLYQQYPFDALTFEIRSGNELKTIEVKGAEGAEGITKKTSINSLNVSIKYGSKIYKTPFKIKLRDFEMKRYPGTNSASSYASEVTVIDSKKTFNHRIFMNHVLDYKGFRFFQSSYDLDEKGTILSVNHDYWGTSITYIGYLLMGLSMLLSLFLKNTRFTSISEKIKIIKQKKIIPILLLLLISNVALSQSEIQNLSKHVVSEEHAQKFGKILIQDHQGRIKPINSYALETLRKIYKKDSYKGFTAEQILISAQIDPKFWSQQYIIKAKENVLGKKLSSQLKIRNKVTSMMNFFINGNYALENTVATSFRKKKSLRNNADNEIINLDERANIWWSLLNGRLMHIYPKKEDPNNKWYTGLNTKIFKGKDSIIITMHKLYMYSLVNAIKTKDYSEADELLSQISAYQYALGKNIIPPKRKINAEILYNKLHIFKKLMFFYMILGVIFLILAFINLFKPLSKPVKIALNSCTSLAFLGGLVHMIGLGLRWYISGHEPWSNGYEAVVFVSFISILAGVIFSYKKSKFSLAATVTFASFLLSIAHGSLMNPEMTNLVPVLKSYWLMIHVAIITSSYGFLSLSSILGLIILILYILRTKNNAKKLNLTIDELSYVNELTMTVGLYALSIGTFLGGVWANESWGRYWSWDPKEVWALISMMIYIFVLHMRLIPGLRGQFTFNLASMFSITTLIMTFFGVNYYLSGMHSYAAGDPVPIPSWIYYTTATFILLSLISYYKYSKYKKQTH